VEVEAVFVGTSLSAEEKLAKFAGAEGGPDHSVIEHKLVDGKYGNRALSRTVERQIS
jgi:hypothetical protein